MATVTTITIPRIDPAYDSPAWTVLRQRIADLARLELAHKATRRDLEHARDIGLRDAKTQQQVARASALVAGSDEVPTILRDHEASVADLVEKSAALKLAREKVGAKLEAAAANPALAADVNEVIGAQHTKLATALDTLSAAWRAYDGAVALAGWLGTPHRQGGRAATHLPALSRTNGQPYTVADVLDAMAAWLAAQPGIASSGVVQVVAGAR
jgi:hypothetical protein